MREFTFRQEDVDRIVAAARKITGDKTWTSTEIHAYLNNVKYRGECSKDGYYFMETGGLRFEFKEWDDGEPEINVFVNLATFWKGDEEAFFWNAVTESEKTDGSGS